MNGLLFSVKAQRPSAEVCIYQHSPSSSLESLCFGSLRRIDSLPCFSTRVTFEVADTSHRNCAMEDYYDLSSLCLFGYCGCLKYSSTLCFVVHSGVLISARYPARPKAEMGQMVLCNCKSAKVKHSCQIVLSRLGSDLLHSRYGEVRCMPSCESELLTWC